MRFLPLDILRRAAGSSYTRFGGKLSHVGRKNGFMNRTETIFLSEKETWHFVCCFFKTADASLLNITKEMNLTWNMYLKD